MSRPEDVVRVIRVLEYVGDRDWVEGTLRGNFVKGTKEMSHGMIREAIVGDFPEVVNRPTPPEPLAPCPDCGATTFRTASDRDRHLLRCRDEDEDDATTS